MKVEEYLAEGKTLEDLTNSLAIRVARHDELPLAILNYNQIESPKCNEVAKECRGLVINTETKKRVARSFPRFFNWGEDQDSMKLFDFGNSFSQEKIDGSLVLLFNFDGKWMVTTRGSFAQSEISPGANLTWEQGVCAALDITSLNYLDDCLDRAITYVCEFCSPYNKVVKYWKEPCLWLLTTFVGETELDIHTTDLMTNDKCLPFYQPNFYVFSSIVEVQKYISELSGRDATYEGMVLRDKKNQRWKVKSATYLALHRLKGEGNNLFHPKYLIPFALNEDPGELLLFFPEASDAYYKVKNKIDKWRKDVNELWSLSKDKESQKDFALTVKDHPLSSILFVARKRQLQPSIIFNEFDDLFEKLLRK